MFTKFLALLLSGGLIALSGCSPEAGAELITQAGLEAPAESADVTKEAPEEAVTEEKTEEAAEEEQTEEAAEAEKAEEAAEEESEEIAEEEEAQEPQDVTILFTSDIHCGVDQNFTLAGVKQIRDVLEANGRATLLADNGDSIQGEPLGTVSKGKAIIELMNDCGYDIATPGNHDFDYGMDNFLELADVAGFPYISCNFNKEGELVFDPYIIKEVGGFKIGFVGVTTPKTIITSTPKFFQDEKGNFIYGFMQDETGEALYEAVQKAVDDARAEGADYIVVMGHIGNKLDAAPYTYVDIIENTTGIDAFLDGHSHDTDQAAVKNKDGEEVLRSACGTKLNGVGYLDISAEDGSLSTGVYTWNNSVSVPDLLGIENEMSAKIAEQMEKLDEDLGQVVAKTAVELTIFDPEAKDDNGNPIRIVRRAETNLGDLCADAYREQMETDIAFVNGGGIRVSIPKGDITLGDILKVHPFGNNASVYEVTGQMILDALEWGARVCPSETGGFLQVSGMSYEIHTYIESPCKTDENGMYAGIDGERRVKNVKIGGKDIDPEKTYTLASIDYILRDNGDGFTMFDDAKVILDGIKIDNQVLMDYITETLGGVVDEGYEDPYGEGRIVAFDEEP